jgi:hypothetical protein
MSDDDTADLPPVISREQAENAFREALNLFVGRGKRYKVEQLRKGSGVPKRLIECLKSYPSGHVDYRKVHFGHLLSITKFLGAEFTNEWFNLCDQVAHDIPDEEPDPGELAADTSEDTAKVVRMASDGDLSNDDPTKLREAGTRLMTSGATLVALGTRRRRA